MWIDRVKEAKKALGLSNRAISVATKGKLSERDVTRLIGGEHKRPFVDDVIALGEAVQLTPQQLFGEMNTIVANADIICENKRLKEESASLSAEVEMLKRELEHKKELLKLKDELLDVYRNK